MESGQEIFKEGMNPDPKGAHNQKGDHPGETGLQNIYQHLQKRNWAARLFFSEPGFYDSPQLTEFNSP